MGWREIVTWICLAYIIGFPVLLLLFSFLCDLGDWEW